MLRNLTDRFQNYRRTRQSIRYLEQLDDHSLADIGLGRGEIRRAVLFGRP
ncbi:DUF1127 domain-containing protein [Aurantimonas sp. Leaf443]|nr:DUF1127 domain-containing protein [Aurantimonas sp. Leaf443]